MSLWHAMYAHERLFLVYVLSSSMEDEHAAATRELMARRSQRMKELYEAEYAQLNRELEDMGLTVSKVL